jgi:SAM-dependent methyltransferase
MISAKLTWEDDKNLKVNDVAFYVTYCGEELLGINSTVEKFLIGKGRGMIEKSIAMFGDQKFNNIFDIGIFKGGSVVLYDQIFQPQKIVAIELVTESVEALTQYIEKNKKFNSIKPYYGVNQADRQAMENILSFEFPNQDIDLIIDDASHMYEETRESFNISFPYLKPGGYYVIEDWAWAHWPGEKWQKKRPFRKKRALSNLLIELNMLAASRCDLIENILINHNIIVVKRGASMLSLDKFDIADHYLLRGKRFGAWL